MTTLYDQFAHKRAEIQAEINRGIIKHISFEVYRKTPQEKVDLANAKRRFKQANK